jgi:hypothetical protein
MVGALSKLTCVKECGCYRCKLKCLEQEFRTVLHWHPTLLTPGAQSKKGKTTCHIESQYRLLLLRSSASHVFRLMPWRGAELARAVLASMQAACMRAAYITEDMCALASQLVQRQ